MKYRGIQLDESVKLYRVNGEYNKALKKSLDELADLLTKNNHVLMSKYKKSLEKVLIDFQCNHEPHWITPSAYKNLGQGCPKCGLKKIAEKQSRKQEYLLLFQTNNHVLLSEWKGSDKKVLIDFRCEHKPHWIVPSRYKSDKVLQCPKCSGTCPEQAEENLLKVIKKSGYTLLGKYQTTHTKIKMKCNKGHFIEMTPNDFKGGHRCSKCRKNNLEQAKEDLINLIKSNKHTLLSDYQNTETPVLIDFNCGHEPHEVTPHQYKSKKSGCPLCGKINSAEKRSAEVKAEFPSIVQSRGHKLLTEYERSNKKVLIDFDCGHAPHWIEPHAYKSQKGCPRCADMRGSVLRSAPYREEFPMVVESRGHILLTEYGKNLNEKVLIDFDCGHAPHWITPHDYKAKYGCPDCGRQRSNEAQREKSRKAKKAFSKIVKAKGDKLLTPYKSNHEKVLIDFECGHDPHWITPGHYKSGRNCPTCKESYGEKIIREWLQENKIDCITEYIFPTEKNKRSARKYDIYLPNHNLIIEVHGLQHYEKSFYNKKGRSLKQQQEIDRKKRQHAERLGFNYMEVDYRESKPELALERFLKEFNEYRPDKEPEKQLSLF